MNRFTASALLSLAMASSAFAQDEVGVGGQTQGDYRWAVYTACSLAFGAIIVFLVLSHKRGAKLDEDLQHAERRLDGFSNSGGLAE